MIQCFHTSVHSCKHAHVAVNQHLLLNILSAPLLHLATLLYAVLTLCWTLFMCLAYVYHRTKLYNENKLTGCIPISNVVMHAEIKYYVLLYVRSTLLTLAMTGPRVNNGCSCQHWQKRNSWSAWLTGCLQHVKLSSHTSQLGIVFPMFW